MGEVLKNQSDLIMNQTFTNDIAYRKCYIDGKPVDAKYITYTYYSISKDFVDYHLQFRPGVHFPMGKYVDIPDDTGTYNRWLIVGRSDEPQFVKYNILKCNWVLKWIIDGEIHECLGVLRSRNSYNSGLWNDYLLSTPENQDSIWLPTNPDTQTVAYNMRFLISDNQINPIAWEVSKIEDLNPQGVIKITMKQDLYDPKKDNNELMIADYWKNYLTKDDPKVEETKQDKYEITYSTTPSIKVGGGYKIFSLTPPESDTVWKIVDFDESNYTVLTDENNPSKIKIKVNKDYSLIGKTFYLEAYTENKLADRIQVEVISL